MKNVIRRIDLARGRGDKVAHRIAGAEGLGGISWTGGLHADTAAPQVRLDVGNIGGVCAGDPVLQRPLLFGGIDLA